MKMTKSIWDELKGYKTYIVVFALILYSTIEYLNHAMTIGNYTIALGTALGMAGLRNGINTVVKEAIIYLVEHYLQQQQTTVVIPPSKQPIVVTTTPVAPIEPVVTPPIATSNPTPNVEVGNEVVA